MAANHHLLSHCPFPAPPAACTHHPDLMCMCSAVSWVWRRQGITNQHSPPFPSPYLLPFSLSRHPSHFARSLLFVCSCRCGCIGLTRVCSKSASRSTLLSVLQHSATLCNFIIFSKLFKYPHSIRRVSAGYPQLYHPRGYPRGGGTNGGYPQGIRRVSVGYPQPGLPQVPK